MASRRPRALRPCTFHITILRAHNTNRMKCSLRLKIGVSLLSRYRCIYTHFSVSIHMLQQGSEGLFKFDIADL